MSDVPHYYRQALRRFDKLMHPNWPIGTQRVLGDYGVLNQGRFEVKGNLADLNTYQVRAVKEGQMPELLLNGEHSTADAAQPSVELTHDELSATSKLRLNFDAQRRVALVAADVCTHRLVNVWEAQSAVFQLCRLGIWRNGYSVVTSVVEAQAHLLAIANQSQRSGHIRFTINIAEPTSLVSLLRSQVPLLYAGKRSTEAHFHLTSPSALWFGIHQLRQHSFWQANGGTASLQPQANRPGLFNNNQPGYNGQAHIYTPPKSTGGRQVSEVRLVPILAPK